MNSGLIEHFSIINSKMSKQSFLKDYKDIVEPRRVNNDAVGFMTRHWQPQPAHRVKVLTPTQLKAFTAKSKILDQFLDELCPVLKKSKAELQKEMISMLEEIGLDRKMYNVRWLGVFTTKVLCRMYTSVLVNEKNIFSLKGSMGHNPVVFVPTHRSYGDFILMTYISFYYDIELPAVAAGMDFHAMVGMGRIMRNTCAFYMRRTFATDKLYGAVFRQYVRTLITHHHSPVQFFIEGTRSRSGKSMAPKYGFMSMVLEPLFSNEVSDITFVPINISYDKVLEERLFAYEMLGVPKPKESTSGLLRALNILSDSFGSIYINVGEPLSAKKFFGASLQKTVHPIRPIEPQSLSPEQNFLIQNMSHEIVYRQQQRGIITTFQLLSVSLTISLHNSTPLSQQDLTECITWLSGVFRELGANVLDYDEGRLTKDLKESFVIHNNLVKMDKDSKLRLINSDTFLLTDDIKKKMKGHQLSVQTMSTVIPVIMTQLYVNPVLHWIISAAIIHLIIFNTSVSKAVLWESYKRLRNLLRYEFPVNSNSQPKEFDNSLQYMLETNGITEIRSSSGEKYILGGNERLNNLMKLLSWPFLSCLYRVCLILVKQTCIEEKMAMRLAQQSLEWQLSNKEDTHPYCLSLDSILNCIQGLVAEEAIRKERSDKGILYHIDGAKLTGVTQWIESLIPDIHVKFDRSNPVMMEQTGILAKM